MATSSVRIRGVCEEDLDNFTSRGDSREDKSCNQIKSEVYQTRDYHGKRVNPPYRSYTQGNAS